MAIKLDMSKFKKVSSDKDTTIMRHDDGHQIKIAHSALSPSMRKQLAKLPAYEEHEGQDSVEMLADDKVADARYAEGGNVAQENSTPKVEDNQHKPITINIGTPQQMAPVPQALQPGAVPMQPEQMPTSAPRQPAFNMGNMSPQDIMPQATVEQPPQLSPAQEVNKPTAVGKEEQEGVKTPKEISAPGATSHPSSPAASMTDEVAKEEKPLQAPSLADAYQQQLESNVRMGEEQAKLAQNQERSQLANAQALNNIHTQYQNHYDRIDGEIKNVIEDIKTHQINPNQFMGSMDTDRRIQTALGLALSGFGSTLTGGPNQALEFLNKQIDRDIDAQKASLGKKNTLLNAYMNEYGNLREAENMTRLTMQAVTQSKLAQAESKAQAPIAKVRAQQLNAALQADMAPKMQQQALNMMLMKAGASGQEPSAELLGMLDVTNPQLAKEYRSRIVPTVGMAKVPVSEKVRDELFKRTNLVRATDNLIDWVKKNGGSPNPSVRAEGETLARELQQVYRQGVGAPGNQEEQKIMDEIINSDPGSLSGKLTGTTEKKLKALRESMNSSLNTLKEQHQLPKATVAEQKERALPPQQQSFVNWARTNPNDPRAKLVLKKLGLDE